MCLAHVAVAASPFFLGSLAQLAQPGCTEDTITQPDAILSPAWIYPKGIHLIFLNASAGGVVCVLCPAAAAA